MEVFTIGGVRPLLEVSLYRIAVASSPVPLQKRAWYTLTAYARENACA